MAREEDHAPICPICMEDMWSGWETRCGHRFHGPCLQPWMVLNERYPTCPVCRHLIWPSTIDRRYGYVQFLSMIRCDGRCGASNRGGVVSGRCGNVGQNALYRGAGAASLGILAGGSVETVGGGFGHGNNGHRVTLQDFANHQADGSGSANANANTNDNDDDDIQFVRYIPATRARRSSCSSHPQRFSREPGAPEPPSRLTHRYR